MVTDSPGHALSLRFKAASLRTVLAAAFAVTGFACIAAPSASAATLSFSNTAAIAINDSPGGVAQSATPYPSQISVSGLTGTVSAVTATLHGFHHTCPQDVDVLLVGPTGANTLLMSDAGDCTEDTLRSAIDLTFDDSASTAVPCSVVDDLAGGTYQPANYPDFDCTTEGDFADSFPAPAPAGPWGTTLGGFAGKDPNGTWRLYVVDDQNGDSGAIDGGWSVAIAIAPPTVTAPTISGTAAVGQTLTAHSGTVTGGGTPSFSWNRCDLGGGNCSPIGATGPTYVIASDDAGHALSVTESVTNSGGSDSADSDSLDVLANGSSPPPSFSTKARQFQSVLKIHGVVLSFSSSSGGLLVATGTVNVPNTAKTYRFTRLRKRVSPGKVAIKLKLSARSLRAIKQALRQHHRLSAKITLTLTGKDGRHTVKRTTVRLR